MSCEIGALIENVERKCFTLPSEVRHNLSPHVGVRDYVICVYSTQKAIVILHNVGMRTMGIYFE